MADAATGNDMGVTKWKQKGAPGLINGCAFDVFSLFPLVPGFGRGSSIELVPGPLKIVVLTTRNDGRMD